MRFSVSKNLQSGMTLVEVIIYSVLLSFLVTGMINFLYSTQMNDAALLDEIEYEQTSHIF